MSIFQPSLSRPVDTVETPAKSSFFSCAGLIDLAQQFSKPSSPPTAKRKLDECNDIANSPSLSKSSSSSSCNKRSRISPPPALKLNVKRKSRRSARKSSDFTPLEHAAAKADRVRDTMMQMRAEEIYLHVPVSPPPEPLTSIESVATQANTSSTSAPRSLTGQGSLFSSIFQTSAMPQTNFGLSNNRSDNDEELRKDKQKNEEHLAKIISYDDDIQRRLSRFEHSNWKAVSLDLYNSKTPCASARELALLQFVRDLQLTRSQLMHHKIVCDPEDIDYPFKDKKYKYKGRACSHKDCTEKKRQATLCKHHFHKFRCLGKHTLVFC